MSETTEVSTILVDPKTAERPFALSSMFSSEAHTERAFRFAAKLANSELVPSNFRGKPNDVFVGLVYAGQFDIPAPVLALANIGVVDGKPSIHGDLPLALVMRHPEYAGQETRWSGTLKGGDLTCTFEVRRMREGIDGEKFLVTEVGEFSIDDAKAAGLWGMKSKTGRPLPWSLYPRKMLKRRAVSDALHYAFPDVVMGMAIMPEEDFAAEPSKTVTVQVKREPATESKPATQDEPAVETVQEVDLGDVETDEDVRDAEPSIANTGGRKPDPEPKETSQYKPTGNADQNSPLLAGAVAAANAAGVTLWHSTVKRVPPGIKAGDLWLIDKAETVYEFVSDGGKTRPFDLAGGAADEDSAPVDTKDVDDALAEADRLAKTYTEADEDAAAADVEAASKQLDAEPATVSAPQQAEPGQAAAPERSSPQITRGKEMPETNTREGDVHLGSNRNVWRFQNGAWMLFDLFMDAEAAVVGRIIRGYVAHRSREMSISGADIGDAAESIMGDRPANLSEIPIDVLPRLLDAIDPL